MRACVYLCQVWLTLVEYRTHRRICTRASWQLNGIRKERMRIVSLNVNGIRAAERKGLFSWLPLQSADVFCLQEIRAQPEQISAALYKPANYHVYHAAAVRRGYSGVAIFCRQEPDCVVSGFGSAEFDAEGRYIEARFGNLSIVSVYMPSGSSSEDRQAAKFRFMDEFTSHLQAIKASGRNFILCGDWNIAHKEIDLRNWKANQKNSGFLPEERRWLDTVFDNHGFIDAFREVNQQPDQYTWWSNRGRAWDNNVGWRIDYQVVTPALKDAVSGASIYKSERFSDHAPLIIDYALD
jgi:exodeoxyribonuclease-3